MNSDSIKFSCPGCKKTISTSRASAGSNGVCPACGNPVVVPKPSALRHSPLAISLVVVTLTFILCAIAFVYHGHSTYNERKSQRNAATPAPTVEPKPAEAPVQAPPATPSLALAPKPQHPTQSGSPPATQTPSDPAPISGQGAQQAASPTSLNVVLVDGAMLSAFVPSPTGDTKVVSGNKDGEKFITGTWRDVPVSIAGTNKLKSAYVYQSRQNSFGGTDSEGFSADADNTLLEILLNIDIPSGTFIIRNLDHILLSERSGLPFRPVGFNVCQSKSYQVFDDGLRILEISEEDMKRNDYPYPYALVGSSRMPKGSIWFATSSGARRRPLPVQLLFKVPAVGRGYSLSVMPGAVGEQE